MSFLCYLLDCVWPGATQALLCAGGNLVKGQSRRRSGASRSLDKHLGLANISSLSSSSLSFEALAVAILPGTARLDEQRLHGDPAKPVLDLRAPARCRIVSQGTFTAAGAPRFSN